MPIVERRTQIARVRISQVGRNCSAPRIHLRRAERAVRLVRCEFRHPCQIIEGWHGRDWEAALSTSGRSDVPPSSAAFGILRIIAPSLFVLLKCLNFIWKSSTANDANATAAKRNRRNVGSGCRVPALSRCRTKSAKSLRLAYFQAATTAVRHMFIADARNARRLDADVRQRWTLKVLQTAAWAERNF